MKDENNRNQPIIGRLVGAVVEHLQELWTAKVKHELRVERELLRETERAWIVFVKVTKLLTLQLHRSIMPASVTSLEKTANK